ncbi:MAG: hypothetical protein ACR2I2_05735 [Bryobacteraceae bacterium]
MSIPPIPPPLEHLGTRHFSFYPPILNIEHNEWTYRSSTWSEILVVNVQSAMEVWIPRRFLGEVSRIEDPVLIVGLLKEIEYKGGAIWPHRRHVIEMPIAVGERRLPVPQNAQPAPVVGIRLESSTDVRAGKMVVGALVVGVLACLVVANTARQSQFRQRVNFTTRDQSYLELTRDDDYYAVVRKLGAPASDRWRSETGELQYRALSYPDRGYKVILMGTTRPEARYIGAVDEDWNPVHVVQYATGGNSGAMLRNLHKF